MKNVSPLEDPPPPPDPPHPEKPDKIINKSADDTTNPRQIQSDHLYTSIKTLLMFNASLILFIRMETALPVRYNKGAGHSHSKERLIGQNGPTDITIIRLFSCKREQSTTAE